MEFVSGMPAIKFRLLQRHRRANYWVQLNHERSQTMRQSYFLGGTDGSAF